MTRLILALAVSILPSIALSADDARISPNDAAARVRSGESILIDIREPSEWEASGVVATAHLLPNSDLNGEREQWNAFLKENTGLELIFYCRSGGRAGRAAELLAKEGFRTANGGGIADWIEAGQPLRKADEPREEK